MKLKDLKFTPGPWRVYEGWTKDSNGEWKGKYFPSVMMTSNKQIVINESHDQEIESIMANAVLVSKAPEMLEKLKKAEEALQGLFLPMKGPSAFLDAQSKCKETLKEITDLLNS